MRRFGYIRVSTKDQSTLRQEDSLRDKVDDGCLFIDKASGKDFARPEYQLLKRAIREGDILYLHSLDRLGRNKDMIKDEWKWFKDKGIKIVVLDMPMLSTEYDNSLMNLMQTLVFEVLTWVAEDERIRIKKRQVEGIASAKFKGTQFGRPKAKYPEGFEKIYSDWKSGKVTAVKAMELLNLKRTTFYKLVKEHEVKNQDK